MADPAEDDTGLTIVVGVGTGLGAALARRFAQGGHPVALIARRPAELHLQTQHRSCWSFDVECRPWNKAS